MMTWYAQSIFRAKSLARRRRLSSLGYRPIIVQSIREKGVLSPILMSLEEINACTKAGVDVDGKDEDWLLPLQERDSQTHPTEISLWWRSYLHRYPRPSFLAAAAHQAASRALQTSNRSYFLDTSGKLSAHHRARRLAGYSSHSKLDWPCRWSSTTQATWQKRMEIGAVVGAIPQSHARRERPEDGDITLLGGRTVKDGIGGATGFFRLHDAGSIERRCRGSAGSPLLSASSSASSAEDACKLIAATTLCRRRFC